MSAARNLDAEFLMEERTIRLEERVASIQTDVAEIKVDYRRLDAKVDATRDSVSDVKDSVGALRVEMTDGFRAVDRQIFSIAGALGALDGAVRESVGVLNGSLAALHAKMESLSSEIRGTKDDLRTETSRLSAKIDETVNTVFDRKFFRAFGVFGSALPLLAATFAYIQRASLGMTEIVVIAVAMSLIICVGTFLATRRHR
jgi:predicted  nucleic acid-binding Zn-ribbon protein